MQDYILIDEQNIFGDFKKWDFSKVVVSNEDVICVLGAAREVVDLRCNEFIERVQGKYIRTLNKCKNASDYLLFDIVERLHSDNPNSKFYLYSRDLRDFDAFIEWGLKRNIDVVRLDNLKKFGITKTRKKFKKRTVKIPYFQDSNSIPVGKYSGGVLGSKIVGLASKVADQLIKYDAARPSKVRTFISWICNTFNVAMCMACEVLYEFVDNGYISINKGGQSISYNIV